MPLYFLDFFAGFENIKAVKELFGDRTYQVLNDLKIEFADDLKYMEVVEKTILLRISKKHLRKSPLIEIYLDIIHELVHVKQFLDGRKNGHELRYVDRPLEIEAYRIAVREAKRLGLSDKQIFSYLWAEWLSRKEVRRLASHVGVKVKRWRIFPRGNGNDKMLFL